MKPYAAMSDHGGLLDRQLIAAQLTRDAPWSGSHGAEEDYLGGGLLYYAIVYVRRASLAVCLGSGGGFVPRVMRQAQRDLGIAHRSRTVLVDGVVPEAGWGSPVWLDQASFFRTHFPDVELVLQRTTDAVGTFAAGSIDYLHIDADHSFAGCLEDFEAYRPLLADGALVTLHDTAFPGAGVHHVVERLRARADCEVIDLSDLGVGTALVRVSGAGRTLGERSVESGALRVTRKPDAPAMYPPQRGWAYLESEAFTARNVLAARYVADCPTVVEIGGWRTPIDRYAIGAHEAIIVVDPLIDDARREGVEHLRARFQDLYWQILRPREYGLVILGLEIQGLSAEDERVLYDLVENAAVAVLEFPSSWDASREQYEQIRAHTRTRERLRLELDLSGNDVGDLSESWAPRFEREIHVLSGA